MWGRSIAYEVSSGGLRANEEQTRIPIAHIGQRRESVPVSRSSRARQSSGGGGNRGWVASSTAAAAATISGSSGRSASSSRLATSSLVVALPDAITP